MTLSNPDLWTRISGYVLPLDSGQRTFEEQLRAEHPISEATALDAIEEYRRFIYLTALSDDRTVPSRAVDAVWHLHLGHTRDYWDRFCDRIGFRLHHTPGTPQGHGRDFARTLALYRREFGHDAPAHFWGAARDGDHVGRLIFGAALLLAATTLPPPLHVIVGGGAILLMASAVPGLLRALGILRTPALRNRPARARSGRRDPGNCGGAGCSTSSSAADCGGGGCGGD